VKPYTVGLTGGIGSGKSAVAGLFAGRGIAVIDTDEIAHELTRPGGEAIEAIRAAFGAGLIGADGALDRDGMRKLVFGSTAARKKLEGIRIRSYAGKALAGARTRGAPTQFSWSRSWWRAASTDRATRGC